MNLGGIPETLLESIQVPPLSARIDDLRQFCGVLLGKLARRLGRTVSRVSPEGLRKLQTYSFPGNVRELENILERAIIFTDGEKVGEADFLIRESNTAQELGISRRTLLYGLKSIGMQ